MPPSLPLVSQYLPLAYAAIRAGEATLDPADLAMAHVAATLDMAKAGPLVKARLGG